MKRQHLILILSCFALLGSLAASLGTLRDRDYQLRGYVDPTRDFNLSYRVPRLGVNVELDQYSQSELEDQLERIEVARITWLRQAFRWNELEPEQSQFRWEQWDSTLDAIRQHPTLRVVAVLVNSPIWARTELAEDNPTAPPNNPADFATFAAAFAARYGDTIDYYEIWDEPNLIAAWGGLEPRPAEYLALLEAAYSSIHSLDSTATVIVGGLAPTVETGPRNISDILFLRALYSLGAKEYMDGVGAKPHGFNTSPTDRDVNPNILNFSRIIALREEMISNGDGQKGLWAVSWGWNSLPDDWRGAPSIWGSVNSEAQVQYTLDALTRAEREWPWLQGMILQHWQPDVPTDDPHWGFALVNPQGSPNPLYSALLARAEPLAASNGLYPVQNPYARYSGVWTFGELGADIGWLRDSQLDFGFTGRDIALLLRKDNYVGYLYPTVDLQPANATPLDANGNAYIVLTSGTRQPEVTLVPVAVNLQNTLHTLHVVADRGWDRWALAGYAVSDGDLSEPYNRQFAIACLTAAVATVSTTIAAYQVDWRPVFRRSSVLWQGLNFTSQLIISVLSSGVLMIGMLLTWGDASPNILRRDTVQVGLSIITGGLIYLEPGIIITVVAVIILFIIFFHRIELGLLHTIFWAPFFLFPIELYRFAFPMVEIMVLLTIGAWLLKRLIAWGQRQQNTVSQFAHATFTHQLRNLTTLDWALIAWLTLGFVSLLWAKRQSLAITELRVLIVEPCLFYLVLRSSALKKETILRLVDTLLITGLVVAVIGFATYLDPQLRITAEGGAQRLTSVYGSPNNVGLFLGRCLPFALAFLRVKTDLRRRQFATISLIIMSLAVILTQSVGALFIGIPASIIAVILFVFGKRAWRPLAAVFAIGAVAFFIAMQYPRFARVLNFNEGTNFFRIRVWESAIDLIRDYPLTGVGLDQFLYEFRGHYIRPDAEAEPNLSHPHNFVLDFWIRLGILGVVLFAWMQFGFWRRAKQNYQRLRHDPFLWALSIGLMGSMVNLLAHGLIDNSVYVIDLSYVFVLLLGLTVNVSNNRAIDDATI
jgi:O-antigen ligase